MAAIPTKMPPDKRPWAFFLLTFALSLPLWWIGGTSRQFLPGLPISALMAICPLCAALLLTRLARNSAPRLLIRAIDYRRIPNRLWYAPILLLIPGILTASYLWMRLSGASIPPPSFSIPALIAMPAAFFAGALSEELGWTAYALEALEPRGALRAALLIGVVWALWHIVPYRQAHRSPDWIAWQALNTVALRVLLVWLYRSAGQSVCATILFHTSINLSDFLFPVYGSFFDPRTTGILTSVAAAMLWATKR